MFKQHSIEDVELIEEIETGDSFLCPIDQWDLSPEGDLIVACSLAISIIMYGAAKSAVLLAQAAKELTDGDE